MRRIGQALLVVCLLCGHADRTAHAQAASPCPLPETLMLRDLALPAAKAALARDGRLVILSLGGAATAGDAAGDPAATYPARLQAALAAALPGKAVTMVNKASDRRNVATLPPDLAGVIRETGAQLVIWATGAREAGRNTDIDDYVARLESGVDTIRKAGADLILLDMQYAPSIARIVNFGPYRDALRGIATIRNVPLLRRFELMQRWNDDGVLNLDAQNSEERRLVAGKLFACIAAALAPPIAQAVR